MFLNQEEKALVTELRELGPPATPYAGFIRPGLHRKRVDFYQDLIFGDSGNPAFLIVNETPVKQILVLLTTATSAGAG